ncbi:MAG TPA: hypothetical protein VIK18_05125 [Pirellulales bacterium]
MADRPLRFVHAGDFHLERPLIGVSEVPDHLRDAFIDAPYRAAQKVFDAVLEHDAQFLALSGDLIHPHLAGPRGLLFLIEQCERLAVAGKNVYWAAGEVDSPADWPTELRLPANVRTFSPSRPEEYVELRDGRPVCHVTGQSFARRRKIRAADFWPDKGALFSVAVAYGAADPAALATRSIHYWALGSAHAPATPLSAPCVAHYCGTTQGREPAETGPHGCTLVSHEPGSELRLALLPTDAFRWISQRLHVDASTTQPQLERMFDARLQELSAANPGVALLVSWHVTGTGPIAAAVRRGQLGREVLARLRGDYGHRPTSLWSVSLEFEPAAELPEEWYEQETILGEFLRLVREQQPGAAGDDLDLEAYLSRRQAGGNWTDAVRLDDAPLRARVLRHAALLGADLLTGEETHA